METLINQLVDDVQKEFAMSIDYSNLLVKEIYEIYPEISDPAITIEEIENQTGYDLSDPNSILEIALALRIKKFMK